MDLTDILQAVRSRAELPRVSRALAPQPPSRSFFPPAFPLPLFPLPLPHPFAGASRCPPRHLIAIFYINIYIFKMQIIFSWLTFGKKN